VFTGIVEELGSVVGVGAPAAGVGALRIACGVVVADARIGDSISVNGCCLTVTALHDGADESRGFSTELMGETLDRTALGRLRPGDVVNLEPAMRAEGRFGGHVVQGHVDAVADVLAVEPQDAWTVMRFALPPMLAPYVVEKGSITVDGTSLTVMDLDERSFSVGLIPHTLSATVLGIRRAGDAVNLEADVIAKYVERQLQAYRTAAPDGGPDVRPAPDGGPDGPPPIPEGSST
jgi:riboflavin synthase